MHIQWNITQPLVMMWMELEIIMLSEVRQRRQISWCLYVESKKKRKGYRQTYLQNRVADVERKLAVACKGLKRKEG